ncbi:MAG: Ig-like domain-containing protein [Eubacterium sp.]|nr:Ig-like domain-containing protein [Eubacterium sp.]
MRHKLSRLTAYLCVLAMVSGMTPASFAQAAPAEEVILQAETGSSAVSEKEITFSLDRTSYTYTGSQIKPAVKDVTVMVDGSPLALTAEDYSVAYADNENAGSTARVILAGKGKYEGCYGGRTFTIRQADISTACQVSLSSTSLSYTGSALTPKAVLTMNGKALKENTDYQAVYYNNTNAGTATVTVKGAGNYTGQVTMKFTIGKAAQGLSAAVSSKKMKTNKSQTIKVRGNQGTVSFKSSKPSVVSVSKKGKIKALKPGSATITVTSAATANYRKTTAKIKISVEGKSLTKDNTRVVLSKKNYTYNGNKKTPAVRKVTYKGKTLKKNRDYKISYQDNVNAGTARVIIRGINKYSGKVKAAYKIKKAANTMTTSITKTSIDVNRTSYIEVTKAFGTVRFKSSDSSVASVAKNGVITGKKNGSCTITVTAAGDQNHKSASKKYNIVVGVRDLSDPACTISLSAGSYVYDGSYKKPSVTVKYNGEKLTLNKDYALSYYNNLDAGTAKVYVSGKGKYQGIRLMTYTIAQADQKSFSIALKNNRLPLGGKAKVSVTGSRGELTYGSYSPSYAHSLGGGWYEGLKKTQNYVTITVRAAGDKNYAPKTLTLRVQIY